MIPGETIDQRFIIEQLAASGGMGAVYRSRDIAESSPVAIKVLLGVPQEGEALRFEREAQALAGLRHAGVVRYLGHGASEGGQPYLAMEWVDGPSLAERLERGPLTIKETVTLGIALAEALGAAHRLGIVHRDLKPSNVLLEGGSLERAKIVDFGLATMPQGPRATLTGEIVGTPEYMAPEQASGSREAEPRTDVFALGSVLYECITGEAAFKAQHVMAVLVKILFEEVPRLRQIRSDVPPALEALVARMLSKDPQHRPEDGSAVAAALAEIGGDSGESAVHLPLTGGLTGAEQRVVSVVLARPRRGVPTLSATLAAISARGGSPVPLADGTIAVTVHGAGLAKDHAALAAEHALVLRDGMPGAAIAIATGRAEVASDRAVGDAIERAASMICARERTGLAAVIDLDEVTAGLLDLRFEVIAGARGLELACERDVAGAVRTLLGKPTPFVGRKREIATLEALFDECAEEGAPRVALVTAPAGVGKSRLRHEITAKIAARGGVEVWIARGDPMRVDATFGLVAQIVRRTARLLVGEPITARRRKLLARVSRHVAASERLRVAEFLGEISGAPFPSEDRVQLRAARQDPRLLGDQVRRAFVDWLDAESAAQPVAILFEDLHWGDAPSMTLVDAALGVLSHRPIFVLAMARPDIHDRMPKLWHERAAQEIRLTELSRRDCERFVQEVLGDLATPGLAAMLAERSQGNVFFLEELLRATAEGREAELPETLIAMVESRLDALSAEDRRLLRAASILGDSFWVGGLNALLGWDERRPLRLAELERREWISRHPTSRLNDEEEYVFRHALVREAAYRTLTADDRKLGHRLAAAWLESAGETDAVVLAKHFESGEDDASAVKWYCAAAEQAIEGNDLPAVIARVDRAVALGASGEALGRLSLCRALAHNWRGEHAEAEPWARTATESLPAGSGRWCAAMGELIWTVGNRGDDAKLAELGDTLLASRASAATLRTHTLALACVVTWLVGSGRYDEARSIQRSIDASLDRLHDEPAATAAALVARAFLASLDDDPSTLRELLMEAAARFDEAGDRRQASLQRSNVAEACNRLGASEQAEAIARSLLAETERENTAYARRTLQTNLGVALVRRGALDEACSVFAAAVDGDDGNPRMDGITHAYLADALQRRGDLAAAETEARLAVVLLSRFPGSLPIAAATLAGVLLAQGRAAEALEYSRSAFEGLEALGNVEEGEALVRLVHAEVLHANGDLTTARKVLSGARRRLLARAANIADDRFRSKFLQNVPENARTLALSRLWLDA